jgi:hypothetical protein
MNENAIGSVIVDSAVHLHQAIGPGLLESVYEVILTRWLEKRGVAMKRRALPKKSNFSHI